MYKKYVFELFEKGYVYKDFKEGLEDFVICFKVLENVLYEFDDVICGILKFEFKDVEDWIILKDNGIFIYNFVVVIDDYYMEIIYVFRGEEYIINIFK